MKIKQFIKIVGISVLIPAIVVVLSSGGGGKKPKDGKNPQDPTQQTPPTSLKSVQLILYPFNTKPAGRNDTHGATLPAVPSLWTGAASAESLFSNPNNYYCKVTVTTADGTTTNYTWKSDSYGGNVMTIPMPDDRPFQLNIEYWEQCGPYWEPGTSYARGLWMHQNNYNYAPQIAISQWLFLRKENC